MCEHATGPTKEEGGHRCGRMPRLVERGKKDRRLGEPSEMSWEEIQALELDPRVELIRQLIPLGLAEVTGCSRKR